MPTVVENKLTTKTKILTTILPRVANDDAVENNTGESEEIQNGSTDKLNSRSDDGKIKYLLIKKIR